MYKLRDYQEKASAIGVTNLLNYNKPFVIQAATGAGKSLIIADICHKIDMPVLILQPSKELLEQNYEKLVSYGVDDISIYSASKNSKEIGKYTYATIGSIYKKPELFKHFKYVIIDECHLVNPKNLKGMYMKFLKAINCNNVCGLTATPYRLKQQFFQEYGDLCYTASLKMINRIHPFFFKKIAFKIETAELIERGYLSPIKYITEEVDLNSLRINSTGADYTPESVESYWNDERIHKLAKIVDYIDKQHRRNLVFCSSIRQATRTTVMLKEKGLRVAMVTGETPKQEREEIVSAFRAGRLKHLINVGVFTTGFDVPELDSIVLAKNTMSLALYYQMCLTMDTEILTDRGFLSSTDINIGDHVYGFDKDTSEIRPVKIQNKIVRNKYNFEKIMQYKSPRLDIGMSDHHDVISRSSRSMSGKWKKQQLKEALQRKDFWHIPVSGYQKPSSKNNLSKHDLELLGWFLSNGSINKHGVARISQSMKNEKYVKEIESLLNKLNISYTKCVQKRKGANSKYKDLVAFDFSKTTRKTGKRGYSYMQEFFDKNISKAYESLTREQIGVLLSAIIKGDGVNKTPRDYKVKTHVFACGKNKIYAERLQSLLVRRGYKANLTVWKPSEKNVQKSNQYLLRVTDTRHTSIAGTNIKDGSISGKKQYKRTRFQEDKNYKDQLWCITNELGTLITRRNGKVAIVGNCGRGVRIDSSNPDKVLHVYDLSGVVERLGRVETIKVVKEDGGFRDIVVSEAGQMSDVPLFTFKVKKAKFNFARKKI